MQKDYIKLMAFIYKIKDYLTTAHRIQFYKTYIQPHIDYCNIIWGGTSQANLNRTFRLQKRACKIIFDYNVERIEELKKKYCL